MSDDLVREAREVARYRNATKQDWSRLLEMLADRSELLEATLLTALQREAEATVRHDAKAAALTAERDALAEKLAKAVLALENIECEIMIDEEGSSGPSDAAREARATLAQITGGKTDE